MTEGMPYLVTDGESANTGIMPGETERIIERHRDSNWQDLEPHLRAFAIEYCQSLCHLRAAEQIGRSGHGLRYLRNPLVLALISDLQKEIFQNTIVNEAFIQQKLLELLPKLNGEEEVPFCTDKGITGEAKKFFPGEYRAALSALGESLKRTNGIRVEHSGKIDHTHSAEPVSIRDLTALFERIAGDGEEISGTTSGPDRPVLSPALPAPPSGRTPEVVTGTVSRSSSESE